MRSLSLGKIKADIMNKVYALMTLLLLAGCQEKGSSLLFEESPIVAVSQPIGDDGETLMVVDYQKFDRHHPIDFPLSDFCDYKLVKLDGSHKDYMLSAGSQIAASENYIVAKRSNELLVFSIDGSYLFTIDGSDGPAGFEGYCWRDLRLLVPQNENL